MDSQPSDDNHSMFSFIDAKANPPDWYDAEELRTNAVIVEQFSPIAMTWKVIHVDENDGTEHVHPMSGVGLLLYGRHVVTGEEQPSLHAITHFGAFTLAYQLMQGLPDEYKAAVLGTLLKQVEKRGMPSAEVWEKEMREFEAAINAVDKGDG